MRMRDGLTRSGADIDAHVIAVWNTSPLTALTGVVDECPDRRLFLRCQSEEVRFVPARDDEAVALVERIGIQEGGGERILGDERAIRQAPAERAGHEGRLYNGRAGHTSTEPAERRSRRARQKTQRSSRYEVAKPGT